MLLKEKLHFERILSQEVKEWCTFSIDDTNPNRGPNLPSPNLTKRQRISLSSWLLINGVGNVLGNCPGGMSRGSEMLGDVQRKCPDTVSE